MARKKQDQDRSLQAQDIGDESKEKAKKRVAYASIITKVFFDHYNAGSTKSFSFDREELKTAVMATGVKEPSNIGDVPYYFRFRQPMPKAIRDTADPGCEWTLPLSGGSTYTFWHDTISKIEPDASRPFVKIPDSTPEIILQNKLTQEQALLAVLRYNRLVDLFLGISACSLQNHLQTTVQMEAGGHQIEIDEVYLGVNTHGVQFVVPLQAKGGRDKLSPMQAQQDILCCAEKWPNLICRPLAAQFMQDGMVALFELGKQGHRIVKLREEHYKLVPANEITKADLDSYQNIWQSSSQK